MIVGQTAQYTARATYPNGTTADLTTGPAWSNFEHQPRHDYAGRSSDGGRGSGSITVQAVFGGRTATLGVTLSAPPTVTGLSILGSTTVTVGQTAQYTARATYSNGTTADLTTGPTWSFSNTGRATITQAGLLTAVASGQITVQAVFGGRTATLGVTSVTANGQQGLVDSGSTTVIVRARPRNTPEERR